MILRDGTRSDRSFRMNGRDRQRYDYNDVVCNAINIQNSFYNIDKINLLRYFLPEKNKITKVTIHYLDFIEGFRFHLDDGSNWTIGQVDGNQRIETVEIANKEVIVGFKAKSYPWNPACYTQWQFITGVELNFV